MKLLLSPSSVIEREGSEYVHQIQG